MKFENHNIKVFAINSSDGSITPLRAYININDLEKEFKLYDAIMEPEFKAGVRMRSYKCKFMDGEIEREMHLRFELHSMLWWLISIE